MQAYEAALSESAFSGSRRTALAAVPGVAFQSDCSLNPTVFQYPQTPSPLGTLARVLRNSTVRVGQLIGDVNSDNAPW